ncbi:DUF4352 domain-containing protein [Thermomonospora amylolytica]|uniref:DUF4352 domain-containing protein n=1 Tax=Thermomonospora amylolytica TaxID=1411117 RepID=UPI000E6CAB10|nr:DUF4352 domain-containing protein [Thermomonospora amylolytica]
MIKSIGVIVVIAAALTGCTLPAEEPTAVQPAESGGSGDGKPAGDKKKVPVKLTAAKTRHQAGPLDDGRDYTCVRVTVTNQTDKNLEVNPLYFGITGTDGTKHDTADGLMADERVIDTTTLAPGEKASGVVCADGSFTPKIVSFTNPLFSEVARAEVG